MAVARSASAVSNAENITKSSAAINGGQMEKQAFEAY
jgi:hypothetical protein